MSPHGAPHPQGAALVTGAGARVGARIATALAAQGRPVAIHHNRSRGGALAVADEIRAAGGLAAPVQADLTDEAALARLIGEAATALNEPIAVLINCASTFEDDTIETMTRESWDLHMQANLRAPCVLAQAFAAALPADRTGAIVNILDQRVKKPTPQFFTYAISKAGLAWATSTLAQALAPRIRVNAVAPGPTLRNARQAESDWRTQTAATLLGEGSPVESVVEGVLYLVDAHAVTGQILVVDGGQHLAWRTADVWGIAE